MMSSNLLPSSLTALSGTLISSVSNHELCSGEKASDALSISSEVFTEIINTYIWFQCFQEAQDDKMHAMLCKRFDNGKFILGNHSHSSTEVAKSYT